MTGGDMVRHASSFLTAVTVLGLLLAGCAGGPQAGGPCLDDSAGCVDKRVALVNTMATDPNRSWIGKAGSASEYYSGVRLFAYQKTKEQLTCDELAKGIADLGEAKDSLAKGPPPGGSAERNNTVKAMTDDVRGQLEKQRKKKGCA